MKILLVHCAFPPSTWETCLPQGVACLAQYVRSRMPGEGIQINDANVQGMNEEAVLREVVARQIDIVGLSYMTPQADYAYELTRLIKADKRCQSAVVIHGGVHPTALPEDALAHGADICVLGEGEETLCNLLRTSMRKEELYRIPGIAFLDAGEVRWTRKRELIFNLDSVCFPDWSEFPLDRYTQSLHIEKGLTLPIMGSRGCTHRCSYCFNHVMWEGEVRRQSPDRIVTAMVEAHEHSGISRYHFYDDDFLMSPEWAKQVCVKLACTEVKFRWICLVRLDSVCRNSEILLLMKEAGCVGLEIGVENVDDEVLKAMGKNLLGGMATRTIDILRQAKMPLAVLLLMSCSPGETIEKHYEQCKILREKTGLDHIFLGSFATPFPGTRFWKSARSDGLVLAEKWSDFHTENMAFIPYSLLCQRPVRLKSRLSPFDQLLTAIYCKQRLGGTPQLNDLLIMRQLCHLFVELDGSKSVQEIAQRFTEDHGCGSIMAGYGIAIKALLVWAQIGAVASDCSAGRPRECWTESSRFDRLTLWYHNNKNNLYRHTVVWK